MKGANAIARILKLEGIEYLFCYPQNPLIDAAALESIRPVVARTERTAIGMADGFSRVTAGRRIGLCASQYQPGVENSFGGVAQAYSDSSPILFVPAGPKLSRLGVAPTFDPVVSFQPVTKWAARIHTAERIPEFMRRAFTYLRTGRPGPVMLEMPMDVAGDVEVDEDLLAGYESVQGARAMADPAAVAAAVSAIIKAKKPMIHAGAGALYAGAWEELQQFAELLQLPVMTTLPGKSAFPEDHPLSLGSGGDTAAKAVSVFLKDSDLVFGVGASLTKWTFACPVPKGKVAIQLTVDERDLNKDYPINHMLLGDAKLVLRQMIEEAQRQLGPEGKRGDGAVAREIAAIKEEWLAEWMPKLTSNETPINPYRVIWDLRQTVDPRNTIITHDSGSPRKQLNPFWPALEPNSYIGWGKSTHLGYGLPLALGAKVARPDKTVVNVMGDAAFGMSGLEIETAVRNQIGTLTIVMNNFLMGGYEKYLPNATRLYGSRYTSGNYAKVAEGLGAYSERVERPEEIVPALRRALAVMAESRPVLLEFITREENKASKYW